MSLPLSTPFIGLSPAPEDTNDFAYRAIAPDTEVSWISPKTPTAARGALTYPLYGADSCLHLTTVSVFRLPYVVLPTLTV